MVLTAAEVPSGDVRAWINAICAQKSPKEPTERCLGDLEMRLHLASEDLEASLEEDSLKALQKLPGILHEVSRVQGEVRTFNAEVQRLLAQLERSAAAAERTVAVIAQIDVAKTNMEAANNTLKEATELAEVFGRVDAVFGGGSLPNMATLLGTMRRGLQLVGGVPEFDGGAQRLEVLEERFTQLLEPELVSAMSHHDGKKVRQLIDLLKTVDGTVDPGELYATTRLEVLQHVWEAMEPGSTGDSASEWLELLYEKLLSVVKSEAEWLRSWLPESWPQAMQLMLRSFFRSNDAAMRKQLGESLNTGRPGEAMSLLSNLGVIVRRLLEGVRQTMPDAAIADAVAVSEAVYAPIEAQLARYGALEASQLAAELGAVGLPDPASSSTQAIMTDLTTALPLALGCARASVDRCWAATGGTEAPALLEAIDLALQDFVSKMTEIVGAHAGQQAALDKPLAIDGEASAFLPLLHVAKSLQAGLQALEADIQTRLSSLGNLSAGEPSGADVSDPVYLRLHRPQSRAAAELKQLLRRTVQPGFTALGTVTATAASFSDTAHSLIYDLLIMKLHSEFSALPGLRAWQEADPEGRLDLPSFSAYPQAYATAAGEYLMMLPQLLEALLAPPEAGSGAEAEFDADWLDKVAAGAADLYAQKLADVPRLTERGAQQLAADLEYFCNVLSALGVAVPGALATWRAAAQWPADDFAAAASAAAAAGSVDSETLRVVARSRRLEL